MQVSYQTNGPLRVAIIGASGYTGLELTRLLLSHPHVELTTITSRQFAGQRLAKVFPHFHNTTLVFDKMHVAEVARHNHVVFLCLPHNESMEVAAIIRKNGTKVIDLSADFRFANYKLYEKTYGKHTQKRLLKQAVYGLCEIFAKDIEGSTLTAVPGCYVTSVLLALAPLVQNQMIGLTHIICDCKSGTSGAGRQASLEQLFAERFANFSAYGLSGHRHRPEIEEKLNLLAGKPISVCFIPHLLPVSRGILSTIYVSPMRRWSEAHVLKVMKKFYKRSPFIKVFPRGDAPQLKDVVGTNTCALSAHYDDHAEKLILISVLDNLIKGAAGQAVQCLNLMCGFEETCGLTHLGVNP